MAGFLERRRERHAEASRRKLLAAWEAADSRWRDQMGELQSMLSMVDHYDGEPTNASPLQLKRDERVFAVLNGAALIETRRDPGHYQGGYSGFSFRIAKGVRYHVGGSRGTYVQGDEHPTPIDTGTATITNQRVVFQGAKQSREWAFSKLLGFQHDPRLPWTAIQVSNRQKTSGILYDDAHAAGIRFRLALAVAHFNDDTETLRAQLEGDLRELEAERPQPPPEAAPAPPAVSPPTSPSASAQRPVPDSYPPGHCQECGARIPRPPTPACPRCREPYGAQGTS